MKSKQMKVITELVEPEKEVFKPFKLTLTFETETQALEFWAIFQHRTVLRDTELSKASPEILLGLEKFMPYMDSSSPSPWEALDRRMSEYVASP